MRTAERHIFPLALGVASALNFGVAAAQDYPSRPIRMIVAQSPGTSSDTVSRIVAPALSQAIGQPVVVENRPGADSAVGWEYVAKTAPADGYTIALGFVTGLAVLPILVKNLRFDPVKDLPAFSGVAEGRQIFVSAAAMPWKSFNEMIAYARANPGKVNYGSADASVRLNTEGLLRNLGLDVVYVPYSSGGGYVQGLVAGDVGLGVMSIAAMMPFGDKVRVLAVTGDQRRPPYLDVPTFTELGQPQVSGSLYSLNVASGAPKNAFDRLTGAAARAMQDPDLRARFSKIHLDVLSDLSPGSAQKRLAEVARNFAEVAKKAGIQPK